MNEALRSELIEMAEHDLRVRSELVATGELFDGYNVRMAEVHSKNAEKLEQFIEEFGWPGISLVGKEGADAAWLVLQHAIGNPELQRKSLPLLQAAVEKKEMPAFQVACLEDRISVFEGRPQRYGTQFDWDENGMMSPQPLQNPQQVDSYRQAVGLGPLSEKTQEMRACAAAEGQKSPDDLQARKKEIDEWARSVGWR